MLKLPFIIRFVFRRGVFTALLLCALAPLSADVIFLKGGRVVEGRILDQNRRTVTIRTTSGRRVISKRTVRRIRYGAMSNAERKRIEKARRLAAERRRRERALAAERARKEAAEKARRREIAMRLERREKRRAPHKMNWKALGKSALLPGWGQYDEGRTRTGLLYGGGVLVAGLFAVTSSNQFRAAKADYDALTVPGLFLNTSVADNPAAALVYQVPFDAARRKTLSAHARFRFAGWVMLGLYTWNIVEHFFIAGSAAPPPVRGMHANGLELRTFSDPNPNPNFGRQGVAGGMEIAWRFSW